MRCNPHLLKLLTCSFKAGMGCEDLIEPDPSADMTDGQWEDALRKWEIRINLWLKNPKKTAAASAGSDTAATAAEESGNAADSEPRLPQSLYDSTTVGEYVKVHIYST